MFISSLLKSHSKREKVKRITNNRIKKEDKNTNNIILSFNLFPIIDFSPLK